MMIKTVKSELFNEQYTYIKHKSGLSIYVFPKDMSVTNAVIATRFGSIDNCFKTDGDEDFTSVPDGVAHFLEHKMFENSDGEDTFLKFSRTGADGNAYTSFRETAYVFSCTDNIYESLGILISSVFEPYFTEENVKKELGIIVQEIRAGEDDPYDMNFYDILSCLYERNSVKKNIAGSAESVAKITPEILSKCHSTFYHPSNMVLCVCGRVDSDEVRRVCDEVLKEDLHRPIIRHREIDGRNAAKERFERKMTVSKPLFSIGIKDSEISSDPKERMKRSAAMQILSSVCFGKTSRFYNTMLSEGLISPSLSVWPMHTSDFSFFILSGDSDDPDRLFCEFKQYTGELVKNSIDRDDFIGCKRSLYSRFVRTFDSTEEIANATVCTFALDGGDIFEYGEILKDITPEYTESVMRSLFDLAAYAMSVVIHR